VDDTGTDQDEQAPDAKPTDDQASDDQASDERASDDKSTDERASDDKSTDKDDADARLDDLGDRIQSVRSDAEEVVEGVADTEEKKFTESGDDQSKDEDDQTIAPG